MRKRNAKKMRMSLSRSGAEIRHLKIIVNSSKMSKMTMSLQPANISQQKAKRRAARRMSATWKVLRRKMYLIPLIFAETFSNLTLQRVGQHEECIYKKKYPQPLS